jgi:4-hydroxy-tetrahydrodipicolinate reductase
MKIALLGYGRMGKTIEKIALERGHEIVLKVDKNDLDFNLSRVDIAIDFSIPTAAYKNIKKCIKCNVPVVSGTTGWLEKYDEIVEFCRKKNGAFIYASNFSLGVNIFFELNKNLAEMMQNLNQYNIALEEIHHTKKLDAPSGTAITLAEDIIKITNKKSWALNTSTNSNEIPIVAKRISDIPGTHIVSYLSDVDSIEIKHTANNRKGFALGAVVAAEWLVNKKGVYTMKDVLNLK